MRNICSNLIRFLNHQYLGSLVSSPTMQTELEQIATGRTTGRTTGELLVEQISLKNSELEYYELYSSINI